MNKKLIYMNFPVSFLEGAFENIKETIDSIMDYAVYKHSQNLDFGTELERVKSASSFFNLTFGSIEGAIKHAKELMRTKNLKTPNVSINIDILWDYYKNPKDLRFGKDRSRLSGEIRRNGISMISANR